MIEEYNRNYATRQGCKPKTRIIKITDSTGGDRDCEAELLCRQLITPVSESAPRFSLARRSAGAGARLDSSLLGGLGGRD